MAKCGLYPIISRCRKMSTLSHYLPVWQNVNFITLSPLVSKFPLYLFISSCGKMSTLPLCPLMAKCPLYPIISPYGKMLTLSHYLPLWQSKYLSVSPSYCHIFTLFTVCILVLVMKIHVAETYCSLEVKQQSNKQSIITFS